MKQIYYILTISILLAGCGNSEPTTSQNNLAGNIQSDLRSLLPHRTVKADIMDGVLQNPRGIELTKRFQAAIKENYNWFLDYMKTVPEGQPMPYHEKVGLTKEEYAELMEYMNNVEAVSTGQEDIVIEARDDTIRFNSKHKLAVLDSLNIDLKNNIVTFGQYKMTFADTINITSDKNGLKSKWKGYSWKFEKPENLGINDLKDLHSLNVIQYKFTIGRLEKNGKTYMSLKCREVKNGAKMVDFELPIQF